MREIITALRGGAELVKSLDEEEFIHGPKRLLIVNGLNAHLYNSVRYV